MRPIVHIISGLLIAGILFPFIGIYNAAIVFLASWAIDIDHYIHHILKFKNFNLKQSYWRHRLDKARDDLHIFHVIEVWIILVIASFYSWTIFFFTLGLMNHLVYDLLDLAIRKNYGRRSYSVITWIARRIDL